MDVTLVTCQGTESLIEFYTQSALELRRDGEPVWAECLDAMVSLLKHLFASVDGPRVYALTSHYTLKFIAGDDYRLPTLVSIESIVERPTPPCFRISYELPPEESPWKDAWVNGHASDVTQAADMILIALRRNAHASQLQ